jgi:hypothetical protein
MIEIVLMDGPDGKCLAFNGFKIGEDTPASVRRVLEVWTVPKDVFKKTMELALNQPEGE